MHRDISSNTAPDPTAHTQHMDNHQHPTGSSTGPCFVFGATTMLHMRVDTSVDLKDEYKAHGPTTCTPNIQACHCLLLALSCLVQAGLQRTDSLRVSFPLSVSGERKAESVCVLWTLHWQWGSALTPRPFWPLAPRNTSSQVRTSGQGCQGRCVLRKNVLTLKTQLILH